MKKVAWNKINPQSIKKDSIWANIDEKHFQNKELFSAIKQNFATKSTPSMYSRCNQSMSSIKYFFSSLDKAPTDSDTESSSTATVKKTKEFRVLDPKAGQNFGSIFLFDLFTFLIVFFVLQLLCLVN